MKKLQTYQCKKIWNNSWKFWKGLFHLLIIIFHTHISLIYRLLLKSLSNFLTISFKKCHEIEIAKYSTLYRYDSTFLSIKIAVIAHRKQQTGCLVIRILKLWNVLTNKFILNVFTQ